MWIRASRLWAVVASVSGLLGCTTPELPAPVIERVQHPFAFNGDDELVSIHGRHFYPVVAIDAARGGADVDRSWSAWLVGPKGGIQLDRPLVGVGMRDDRELVGTVARGHPPGLYDVELESPNGKRGRLVDGFTVTDTRAEALSLVAVDGVAHPITDAAAVRVQVVDLAGVVVRVPFDVSIGATLEGGGDVTVFPGTLAPSQSTPDGKGVTGTLVDGEATVFVRSPIPGEVTVVATPLGPDSAVTRASLGIRFDPGDDLAVAIRLPVPTDPVPAFEAGVPFEVEAELVDQYGNPVAISQALLLWTECSSANPAFVVLDGPTAVTITPRIATSEDCPFDKVYVLGEGPQGSSALFTVVPGPVSRFDVGLVGSVVQAGDVGTFAVIPQDRHGNETTFAGDLVFALSTGAQFDPICGVGPFPGWLQCLGQLTVAAPSQTLAVMGQGPPWNVFGESDPFEVVADDVAMALEAEVFGASGGRVAAGEAFVVEVTTRDAWGNPIDPSVLLADPVLVSDNLGEIDCVEDGTTLLGALSLACELFTARSGATISVARSLAGLEVSSAPFQVVNGALAAVEVTGPASVVAGSVGTLTLVGEDAFGNPYVVQDDPVVILDDDSGTLSLPSATLGPTGTTAVGGTFTRAGPTVVRALQLGVELGVSAPIQVLPGETSALALRPAAPWAWVGEPLAIEVEAVDPFGNRTGYDGAATLSSETTSAPPVGIALVDGVGTQDFLWTEASFDEGLEASANGFVGDLRIPVSSRCAGPVAAIDFGGDPEAIACTDPLDGVATITADLSASSPGSHPLVAFAVAEVGGALATGTSTTVQLDLPGTGHHPLRALVHDADGCGAEVSASGWTGPNDGRPVGPIPMSTVAVQPSVTDTITIDVAGVVDCARDPAAYAEIFMRTTGGALTATPTGHGLGVALDGNGDAAVELVMSGGMSAGDVEVHATVQGGSAAGFLGVPVTQDPLLPTVVHQDPAGLTAGWVSEVRLRFSEPLWPTSVDNAAFVVAGPQSVTVTAALLPGDQEVLLTLSDAVDASAGAYTVVVPNSVRDAAGNRISGDWSGASAPYVGAFGAAGAVPASANCVGIVPSGLVFRPDGDPGEGVEADEVALTVTSAVAPAWWVLEVRDAIDTLVWQTWTVPTGIPDTLVWAARNWRGMVVPNGVYRIVVAPDDGSGNRGIGCEVALTVDNPLGVP